MIAIQKQLKGEQSFCRNIFTVQNYEKEQRQKPKYNKRYRNNKRYYLRRSNARKPHLLKDKHVRKFNPTRRYVNKLNCYACGEPNHLATNCPKRKNLYNRQSQLIEIVNEDLVEVDNYMSDTESTEEYSKQWRPVQGKLGWEKQKEEEAKEEAGKKREEKEKKKKQKKGKTMEVKKVAEEWKI